VDGEEGKLKRQAKGGGGKGWVGMGTRGKRVGS